LIDAPLRAIVDPLKPTNRASEGTIDMSKLPISLAISDYDHVRDFVSGRVVAEGLDINFQVLPTRRSSTAPRATGMGRLRDVVGKNGPACSRKATTAWCRSRCSVARVPPFGALREEGERRRHAGEAPRQARRRSGLRPHHRRIYARGYLMHDVGLKLDEIEWVQAGTKQARPARESRDQPAAGVKRVSVPDKTLDDMLLAGEIDAILSAIPPKSFIAGNPNMVRLVPNYGGGSRPEYFRRHRHFPDHAFCGDPAHLVREEQVDRRESLSARFEEAKERSIARIRNIIDLAFPRCGGLDA